MRLDRQSRRRVTVAVWSSLAVWCAVALLSFSLGSAATVSGGSESVWVIPIRGTIDLGLASFVERAAREAVQAGAAVILIEVNTFGGRVDAATEIRDTLIRSGVPTAAYITERAWSAGALIALAAETIWMAPGSSIGAAQPVPADEKTVSAVRGEFEATAERTGRDPRIAAAMVDTAVSVEGLVGAGEILTLTANRAVDVGYAEGVVGRREELLAALGFGGLPVEHTELNWAERAARFLSEPVVSQLLLSLGFLGLIAEAMSPGLGVPGVIGLLSLALFYGGRMVVGLVGWEHLLFLAVGLLLIAVEIFLIPGFGVAGLVGTAAVIWSLVVSFGGIEEAIRVLGVSLGLSLVGGYLFWRFGKRTGLWRRVVLSTRLDGEQGYVSSTDYRGYIGKSGIALTTMRPAGVIEIEGERLDAVSEGGYVAAGRPVVVRHVEGTRIVVRELKGGEREDD